MSDYDAGQLDDYIVGYTGEKLNPHLEYCRISNGNLSKFERSNISLNYFEQQIIAFNQNLFDEAVQEEIDGITPGQFNRAEVYQQMIETGKWFYTFAELAFFLQSAL